MSGREDIGLIRTTGYEFPWTYGVIDDTASFDRFCAYFSERDSCPDSDEFESLLKEIALCGKL